MNELLVYTHRKFDIDPSGTLAAAKMAYPVRGPTSGGGKIAGSWRTKSKTPLDLHWLGKLTESNWHAVAVAKKMIEAQLSWGGCFPLRRGWGGGAMH